MAVTGLKWCDFYVWCRNDDHSETIYFDEGIGQEMKVELSKSICSFFEYYVRTMNKI